MGLIWVCQSSWTQSEMRCWIDYTELFGHQYCAPVAVRSVLTDFSDGYNSLDSLYLDTPGWSECAGVSKIHHLRCTWSKYLALLFVVAVVCLYLLETNV